MGCAALHPSYGLRVFLWFQGAWSGSLIGHCDSSVGLRPGARQRVEAGGYIGDDSLPDVLRHDSYRLAAMAAIVRQRFHDAVRNHREGGRQREARCPSGASDRSPTAGSRYIGELMSRGPRYFCSNPAGAEPVEFRRVARRERLRLIGQAGERGQPEDRR